jgi:mannose/cellobiose epimerase-like protein (N-acyl-D-glucosamine 2-epimerase family)
MDIQSLRHWCKSVLLPFWLEASWDRERGGFFDRLDLSGRVVDLDYKRARVQGRQVYVFSHAAVLGLLTEGEAAARSGYDFLVQHAWDRTAGGWRFKVAVDGSRVIDAGRELYCQAFVILGLGWLFRVARDPEVLLWIDRTLAFIDSRMWDSSHGGYWNRWGGATQAMPLPRQQNPHMHLLEAMLALAEHTGEARFLDRARGLVELFRTRFCPPPHRGVCEYFDAKWAPAADGMRREPGHHFEWVWILHHYRRLSEDRSVDALVEPLLEYTLAFGVDREAGMLPGTFDAISPDGTPVQTSKRLWPQTETIKALLAAYEWSGDQHFSEAAIAWLRLVFDKYMRNGQPLFHEHYDREGQPIVDYVPTSSLYHLFVAFTEAMRILPSARAALCLHCDRPTDE